MSEIVVTTFKELDILILENVLCYSKVTNRWNGINEWGRNDSFNEESIPQFTKHPIRLRAMFKKLKKAKVDISFHRKNRHSWEVTVADNKNEFVAKDKHIHIAFIKAALQRANINVEVEIPKGELNTWSEWFFDLCSEYQIHVVSGNLDESIRRIRFEEKKKELQRK